MLDPQASLFKRLVTDAALAALLDTHEGNPAVFSTPMPHNYDYTDTPAALVDEPFNAFDDDTYSENYRVFETRVRIYNRPENGTDGLKAAAGAARDRIKSWPREAVTGGTLIAATVAGPVNAPTDEPNNAGRLLTVRLIMQEN